MSLKINLYRNNNQKSKNYGQVYGRAHNSKPIGIPELAKHMSDHNTPYSKGVIQGILTDMVSCIKELMLLGQPVKISDLCIFKAQVVSSGADTAKDYDLRKNIKAVRLSAHATGEVSRKKLKEDSVLEFTKLAEAIRAGQAELPTGSSDDDGSGDGGSTEPDVRP